MQSTILAISRPPSDRKFRNRQNINLLFGAPLEEKKETPSINFCYEAYHRQPLSVRLLKVESQKK